MALAGVVTDKKSHASSLNLGTTPVYDYETLPVATLAQDLGGSENLVVLQHTESHGLPGG